MAGMEGSDFDELAFFRAIQRATDAGSLRALLIGRRALVVLGLPVLTADYDFWIPPTDIEIFNEAALPFGLVPSRTPAETRRVGRYVLENDEHVDVLTARAVGTAMGAQIVFDDIWGRRQKIEVAADLTVCLPGIDDLIATKQIKPRAKDLEDIVLLEALRKARP
jgi:hypothetical protein